MITLPTFRFAHVICAGLTGLLSCLPTAQADAWTVAKLLAFAGDSCRGWATSPAPAAGYADGPVDAGDLRFGERVVGERFRIPIGDSAWVELDVVMRGGRPTRFVASWFNEFGV